MALAGNLIGEQIGKLKVLERLPSRSGRTMWRCQCDCGEEAVMDARTIQRRQACGKHQVTKTLKGIPFRATRASWVSMLQCSGAQNIAVDPRWRFFHNFFADMGLRPSPFHAIKRKTKSGVFGPGDCEWFQKLNPFHRSRRTNLDFIVAGRFDWDKWHREGEPDYEVVP